MSLPSPIRLSLVFALCSIGVTDVAWARGYRVDQVPGGLEFDCALCHDLRQFTRLTVFGLQVRDRLIYPNGPPEDPDDLPLGEEGDVDWPALAPLDADGDGYTNGEELGDPEGLFRTDDPQPDFPFTRPDLADDFPCGSGTVEGPEACDGEAFAGATCADFGFPGGALACRDDCTIDTAGCNQCGDGVVDLGEVCDGALPDDLVCPDGTVGQPRCTDCAIDLSDCRAPEPDAGPARDAEPDIASDADPDAELDMAWDADPDAEVDMAWDADPDAEPDARLDPPNDTGGDPLTDRGAPDADDPTSRSTPNGPPTRRRPWATTTAAAMSRAPASRPRCSRCSPSRSFAVAAGGDTLRRSTRQRIPAHAHARVRRPRRHRPRRARRQGRGEPRRAARRRPRPRRRP